MQNRPLPSSSAYLEALAGDAPAEPIIRALVDQSVRRLQLVSANLLFRGYPRLMQPPLNLEPDDLLGAVVERLLKAMRVARPRTVRRILRPGQPAHALGVK